MAPFDFAPLTRRYAQDERWHNPFVLSVASRRRRRPPINRLFSRR